MKGEKPAKPGLEMRDIPKTLPDGNGTLNRDVQDVIGKQLRAMYDDLVNRAVPDRFTELLRKLDKPDDEGAR
jgi:hypothetical protein